MGRSPLLALVLVIAATDAHGQAARQPGTVLEYVKKRTDLSARERGALEKALRGASFGPDGPGLEAAKAILSLGIFLAIRPEVAAAAAAAVDREIRAGVPPPIAIHYELLGFAGRRPRGRPLDLALGFPQAYDEELAPDLVAWWERALDAGAVSDEALEPTREALAATRLKMRPLLLDKLRLLARLGRELGVASVDRAPTLLADLKSLDAELAESFRGVARRPEVLDPARRPYDRLRIQLEDMGLGLTGDDKLLDPSAPPPPRVPVPADAPPPAEPVASGPGPAEHEPDRPPPAAPPPPQPRPGDPRPELEPMGKADLLDLVHRYRERLRQTLDPWMGTPYKWGGAQRRLGTDAAGLTAGLYRDGFGIALPRTSRDQYRVGTSVSRQLLRPGDLLFFDPSDRGVVSHVGVYLGDGQFAHASPEKGVVIATLNRPAFERAYRGARRLLAYPRG